MGHLWLWALAWEGELLSGPELAQGKGSETEPESRIAVRLLKGQAVALVVR